MPSRPEPTSSENAASSAPARVALDVMGGDHAPGAVLEGAVEAARAANGDLALLLVGPKDQIADGLARLDTDGLPLHVVDAPDVIAMDESPSAALKSKPQSSIHIGLGAVHAGHADAFASAGNTGAVMGGALVLLGRLAGVSRPALPGLIPTLKGRCILLDVGANMDCKPDQLVQFAHMGRIYAERVLGIESPRVGLLNVGEEPGKGNEATKAAHTLLAELDGFPFVGNVEGRDIMMHAADVVVCDGFVGNTLLKFGESIQTVLPQMIAQALGGNAEALGTLKQALGGVAKRFSYEEVGGTPLLGVDGTVVVGHGSSSARAIARMIETAADLVRADVRGTIADALSA